MAIQRLKSQSYCDHMETKNLIVRGFTHKINYGIGNFLEPHKQFKMPKKCLCVTKVLRYLLPNGFYYIKHIMRPSVTPRIIAIDRLGVHLHVLSLMKTKIQMVFVSLRWPPHF